MGEQHYNRSWIIQRSVKMEKLIVSPVHLTHPRPFAMNTN
jgi:hypothetical protein